MACLLYTRTLARNALRLCFSSDDVLAPQAKLSGSSQRCKMLITDRDLWARKVKRRHRHYAANANGDHGHKDVNLG